MFRSGHDPSARGQALPQAPFTAERPGPLQRRPLSSQNPFGWGVGAFPATEQRPAAKSRAPASVHPQAPAPGPVAVVANPSNESVADINLSNRPSYAWRPASPSSTAELDDSNPLAVTDSAASAAGRGAAPAPSDFGPPTRNAVDSAKPGASFFTPAPRRTAPISSSGTSSEARTDTRLSQESRWQASEECGDVQQPRFSASPPHSHGGNGREAVDETSHQHPVSSMPMNPGLYTSDRPSSPLCGPDGVFALDFAALHALTQPRSRARAPYSPSQAPVQGGGLTGHGRVGHAQAGLGQGHSQTQVQMQMQSGLAIPRPLPVPASLLWGGARVGPLTEAVLLGFARAPPPRLPPPLPPVEQRPPQILLLPRPAPRRQATPVPVSAPTPAPVVAPGAAAVASASASNVATTISVLPHRTGADMALLQHEDHSVGTLLLRLVLAVLIALLAVFVAANMIIASDGAGLYWGPLASHT